MPAKDITHDIVKQALLTDGWLITHDPLVVRCIDIDFFIDLGAEKLLTAEKGQQHIAVEVKSFTADSPLTAFHAAVGQFFNYRLALSQDWPEYDLYLAIPKTIYESFFQRKFTQLAIKQYQIKLLIYKTLPAEIVTWIN
jgi:hypothetical protein